MTHSQFLQSLLGLPVVTTAILWNLQSAGIEHNAAASFLLYSHLVAAAPYILFCAWIAHRIRAAPAAPHLRLCIASPILFLAPLNLALAGLFLFDFGPISLSSLMSLLLIYSGRALGIGYAYVGIGYLVYRVAERKGLFAPAA